MYSAISFFILPLWLSILAPWSILIVSALPLNTSSSSNATLTASIYVNPILQEKFYKTFRNGLSFAAKYQDDPQYQMNSVIKFRARIHQSSRSPEILSAITAEEMNLYIETDHGPMPGNYFELDIKSEKLSGSWEPEQIWPVSEQTFRRGIHANIRPNFDKSSNSDPEYVIKRIQAIPDRGDENDAKWGPYVGVDITSDFRQYPGHAYLFTAASGNQVRYIQNIGHVEYINKGANANSTTIAASGSVQTS